MRNDNDGVMGSSTGGTAPAAHTSDVSSVKETEMRADTVSH